MRVGPTVLEVSDLLDGDKVLVICLANDLKSDAIYPEPI